MIEAEAALDPGEQLRLTFFLSGGFAVDAVGAVMWQNKLHQGNAKCRMGLMIGFNPWT